MGWGRIRVWNDDQIAARVGLSAASAPRHGDRHLRPHRRDHPPGFDGQQGPHRRRRRPGDERRDRRHPRRINLEDEDTTLFQIWIETDRPGAQPGWGAKPFPKDARDGRFQLLASGDAGRRRADHQRRRADPRRDGQGRRIDRDRRVDPTGTSIWSRAAGCGSTASRPSPRDGVAITGERQAARSRPRRTPSWCWSTRARRLSPPFIQLCLKSGGLRAMRHRRAPEAARLNGNERDENEGRLALWHCGIGGRAGARAVRPRSRRIRARRPPTRPRTDTDRPARAAEFQPQRHGHPPGAETPPRPAPHRRRRRDRATRADVRRPRRRQRRARRRSPAAAARSTAARLAAATVRAAASLAACRRIVRRCRRPTPVDAQPRARLRPPPRRRLPASRRLRSCRGCLPLIAARRRRRLLCSGASARGRAMRPPARRSDADSCAPRACAAAAAAAPRRAPPPPQPRRPPAASPSGIVSTRLRPWLEIEFAPGRCVVEDDKVTIEFDVELFNSGSAPARDVLVEASMFNAGPSRTQEIGAFFAHPVGQGRADPGDPAAASASPSRARSA